jgi:putative transposase
MMATVSHYAETNFLLHAFVIMPDHAHLLITPSETLERAIQLIKGGFSFRAKRELNWKGDIWQQGFTDHRIRDDEDWNRHLDYIRQNPVRAHLTEDSVLYPYIDFPSPSFPQGLKPLGIAAVDVRAEARTLQASAPLAARAEARGLQVSAFEVNKKSIEESVKNNATQK